MYENSLFWETSLRNFKNTSCLNPQDGRDIFLQDVDSYPEDRTASHPKKAVRFALNVISG
jgi:hypothetical protein